jgi:hypothetical protein
MNASEEAKFANVIEIYLNSNNLTINKDPEEHERLLEWSVVDINRTLLGWEKYEVTNSPMPIKEYNKWSPIEKEQWKDKDIFMGKPVNLNFLNRVFVLTNQGIHIMNSIP